VKEIDFVLLFFTEFYAIDNESFLLGIDLNLISGYLFI